MYFKQWKCQNREKSKLQETVCMEVFVLHVRKLANAIKVWHFIFIVSQSPCIVEYSATSPQIYNRKMLLFS